MTTSPCSTEWDAVWFLHKTFFFHTLVLSEHNTLRLTHFGKIKAFNYLFFSMRTGFDLVILPYIAHTCKDYERSLIHARNDSVLYLWDIPTRTQISTQILQSYYRVLPAWLIFAFSFGATDTILQYFHLFILKTNKSQSSRKPQKDWWKAMSGCEIQCEISYT